MKHFKFLTLTITHTKIDRFHHWVKQWKFKTRAYWAQYDSNKQCRQQSKQQNLEKKIEKNKLRLTLKIVRVVRIIVLEMIHKYGLHHNKLHVHKPA